MTYIPSFLVCVCGSFVFDLCGFPGNPGFLVSMVFPSTKSSWTLVPSARNLGLQFPLVLHSWDTWFSRHTFLLALFSLLGLLHLCLFLHPCSRTHVKKCARHGWCWVKHVCGTLLRTCSGKHAVLTCGKVAFSQFRLSHPGWLVFVKAVHC